LAEVTEFERVASLEEIPPGTLRRVDVNGHDVCLANADGQIYAFRDNCSHRDFPLSEGILEGDQLECSWHGARFDVTTGRALRLPAIKPIRQYEVRVEDGEIFVALNSEG
jgi:3-phenylpropionate/trans-cinnamate dioxygenase ferredoxin subunit